MSRGSYCLEELIEICTYRVRIYMVIVEICGGLGNQMFRYAFAKRYSELCGDKLYFSLRTYHKKGNRQFSLNNLSLQTEIDEINSFFIYIYLMIMKIRVRYLSRNNSKYSIFQKTGYYKSEGIEAISIPISKKRIKYFTADFQSEKYFEVISRQIKAEFKVKTPPSEENRSWIDIISSTKNTVCVHVRRGDYMNPEFRDRYLVCNEKYYRKAINLMKSKLNNPVFYFFSEDIKWVKSLKFDCNAKYVDLDNPDYEELRLMYLCKNFIISNSTFSWWAQYLSDTTDKIVIAPCCWMNDKNCNYDPIYDSNWILVDNK